MKLSAEIKERLVGTRLEEPLRRIAAIVRAPDAANEANNALTIQVAARVLHPSSNTVDVGAHRGVILRELVALAPAGRHVAVEPLPRQAAALLRRFPTVDVYAVALADQPGRAQFRRVIGAAEGSSFVGLGHDADRVEVFEVEVMTLDQVAPDPVDFVKIDAEQAELLILQGASRVLSQGPVIGFELGANHEQVYELLTTRGYTVTRLRDWLDGRPAPLSLHALRHEITGQHFFLAHR